MVPLGTPAPDFALPEPASDRIVRRSDFAGRPLLVLFACNHCPFVIHLADAIADFARAHPGLALVAISANDTTQYPADAPELMPAFARAHGWDFPYLYDASQDTARAFRAACTPDFFLYDAAHRLAYRGQFDASRPQKHGGGAPDGADLRAAAAAVLAGRAAPEPQRPSLGCNIKWKA
jgi:peroxiredoxin